ncbi:sodium/hydrogen exchanger [Gemmatirosa kalamazoonensis]|uniref:Sodium/hydrogen exchanger n=1 Tax=Gemmatirosa kalamazoonensis TaxID=861299 RepID=W0RF25_9BACT|nr:cation:proton antiporter [Gemmatirosa kalamazoonensis]AHG89396.1 sodium/hydrogen exchanger [Gemmatirosa kalamazoonensis]
MREALAVRRLVILALLYGGLQLVLPLGLPTSQALALVTFGFLILAAYTIGEVAEALRLPKIVGYLAAGMLFGPPGLGTLPADVLDALAPVSALAIALIAFLAGAELQWAEVRARGIAVLKMLSVELSLTFVGLVAVLYLLRGFLPFLATAPAREAIAFSVLFAAVAIVHSPAVTLALLTETGARGPVARTTLGIVLVADVAVVLFFTGALALARALVPPAGGAATPLSAVVWEVGGAVLVGALLGAGVALYLRFVRRELFIFAIVVAFFGAEIARLAHVEGLLTLLTAGFVAENAGGGQGETLRKAMERAASPVFVVFFAIAGARILPQAVIAFWPLVLALVLVRSLGLWGGVRVGARWASVPTRDANLVWMGLVSQAGVAIGLVSVVASVYPSRGEQLRTLFLAVLAINQTLGPVLFRRALLKAGEIPGEVSRGAAEDAEETEDGGLRVLRGSA